MQPLISRRKFLTSLGLAGLGVGSYAHLIEPRWLDTGRHEVAMRAASSGKAIKLLHLADFHAGMAVSLDFISEAIDLGLRWQPDIICVTGDFITHQFDRMAEYHPLLARLRRTAPTYASLGNHDGGAWASTHFGYPATDHVRSLLNDSGLHLLHNEWTTVHIAGRELELVGLADRWSGEWNVNGAFPPARNPASAAPWRIVLSHNPDTKTELAQFPWDLMLCGHTHGGQFRMPVIGAPFAPVKDRRFLAGLYHWNDRWLHITKGVGNVWGLRLNCRPEISLLTLV